MRSKWVGILAFVHASASRPFGEQTGYIRALLATARQLGLGAYAFGPEDVDVDRGFVRAYTWTGSRWRRTRRGLPAIVYDRFFLHQPRPEALRSYRRLRRGGTLRFLNPSLPDKWQVHRDLWREKSVRRLLPPTRIWRSGETLSRALERWDEVVVKPVHGMKGQDLWFVRRRGGRFVVQPGTGKRRVLDPETFQAWSARRSNRRYLLQSALRLSDGAGRPFDIRVLVQREGAGDPVVTGAGVRVGRRGSRVANLHRGGRALTIADALTELPGFGAAAAQDVAEPEPKRLVSDRFTTSLESAALLVARALDRCYGVFAEVGLDFGFDLERGRLYLLEANSRPGRIIFRRMGDHATRQRSIQRPLTYAASRLRRS